MAFGHDPYYIWSDGEFIYLQGEQIPYDVMAQFIAHLCAREPQALNEFIQRGKEITDAGVFLPGYDAEEDGDGNTIITPGFVNPLSHNTAAAVLDFAQDEAEDLPDDD